MEIGIEEYDISPLISGADDAVIDIDKYEYIRNGTNQ